MYNIPISIWIQPTSYPHQPPTCYVTPTNTMEIKKNHQFVEQSGLCHLPYLSKWRADMCHLLGLVNHMISIFNEDPPVYAKITELKKESNSSNQKSLHSSDPSLSPKQDKNQGPDLKQLLVNKIQENLKEFDYSHHLETQTKLENSAKDIDQLIEALVIEKQKTETLIRLFEEKNQELSEWLEKNEHLELPIDNVVKPADPLSNQMFELVSEDAAIQDIFYYLQQAFENNVIDLETFLKQTRVLSRQQFMLRATAQKVFQTQKLFSNSEF